MCVVLLVGADDWWLLIRRSVDHQHWRFAVSAMLIPALPVVLGASFTWCWRRVRWLPYCLAVALAFVVPALLLARLTHLIPVAGGIALGLLQAIGLASAYAMVSRAAPKV